MTHIAIVTVPFIKTERHKMLVVNFLSSISCSQAVDTIAVINSVLSEYDTLWLCERFNYAEHNDLNILARAWNRGIHLALERGAELVVVANLDIVFHPLCLDNLLECSRQEPEALVWSPVQWSDRSTFLSAELLPICTPAISWSCFAVNERLFDVVGEFDEAYAPAYREDSDMVYRLRLANGRGVSCHASLFHDFNRGTIKGLFDCSQSEIPQSAATLSRLRESISRNDEYYTRKWGGIDGSERFTTPFDGQRPKP